MLEKALTGNKRYWGWIFILAVIIFAGFLFYLRQYGYGLGITGLGRDVTWGFYIAQFTFLVGVAASAVMVVLPYYLHDYKAFGKVTVLGEFLAIAAVTICVMFILVDMGQPLRMVNLFLHPSPNSLMFWDTLALGGYLVLNVIITRVTLGSERKNIAPPGWIKPVILLSIPWAISIHTVTAFLYAGLAARTFWMTAILAPRFLASAFSSGPALLIIICFILRKLARYDVGERAIRKLAEIVTYAMAINVFFVLMEIFTAAYSDIPEHVLHFEYLFFGLGGNTRLVPWMWTSEILAVIALVLLINPATRRKNGTLILACVAIFGSIWIDKGLGMIVTGFVPNPLGRVVDYWPTFTEVMIGIGVYAFGALLVTIFYRIALAVKEEALT